MRSRLWVGWRGCRAGWVRSAPAPSAATRGGRWSGRSRISTMPCAVEATTSATGNGRGSPPKIGSYVNERLAILASAKHGLQGRNWVTRFNLRVGDPAPHLSPDQNGETHARVGQPVNDVGEPCAAEPHARFDAAAGGD